MYKLEHTKKLDDILEVLNDSKNAFTLGTLGIKLEEKGIHLDSNELRKIVRKLIDDGYVQGSESFSMKFEGHVYTEAGGYSAKVLKDEADTLLKQLEINRQRTLDANLEKNSKRLNDLTLYLSIGTGALALIETIKFAIFLFPDLKIFF